MYKTISKLIIVSGGSKGIGAALVKYLINKNFKIIVVARTKGEIEKELIGNDNLDFIPTDFANIESREKTFKQLEQLDNIWGIVNNSSGPATGAMTDSSREDFLKAFETHLFTADQLTKLAYKKMKTKKMGRIVNIISVTAKIPLENMGVSNTLRGAMLNWSKTLSKEFAKDNITVNNILPGYTETDRLTEVIKNSSMNQNISIQEVSNKIISQIPLGRFGKPEEVAAVAAFLLSEEASYVNGVSIPVDGGWSPNA